MDRGARSVPNRPWQAQPASPRIELMVPRITKPTITIHCCTFMLACCASNRLSTAESRLSIASKPAFTAAAPRTEPLVHRVETRLHHCLLRLEPLVDCGEPLVHRVEARLHHCLLRLEPLVDCLEPSVDGLEADLHRLAQILQLLLNPHQALQELRPDDHLRRHVAQPPIQMAAHVVANSLQLRFSQGHVHVTHLNLSQRGNDRSCFSPSVRSLALNTLPPALAAQRTRSGPTPCRGRMTRR